MVALIDLASLAPSLPGQATSWVNSWQPLLDDLLREIRPRKCVCLQPELRAPWGVDVADDAAFHFVVEGSCWLQAREIAAPLMLLSGEMAVVTRGAAHTLRDRPSAPVSNGLGLLRDSRLREPHADLFRRYWRATKLLCGSVTFERGASNPLLAILPPVIGIGRAGDRARSWVGLTTQHILSELNSAAKGADEVVT
jgi:hypothetical protein